MRRLAALVLAMTLIVSLGFAQGQTAAKAQEEITGTVDSINPIDPARGNDEGSIFVRDAAGKAPIFIINPATVVTDASSGKIESADLIDGDAVKVTYRVTDAGKIADTILRTAKTDKKGLRLLDKMGL